MNRRDIILKRALAINDEIVPSLIEESTATELQEINPTSQNRLIKQDEINISEDVINLKTTPAPQTVLPSNSNSITNQDTISSNIDNITSVESYLSLDPPSYSPITPQNKNNEDILRIQSDWFKHTVALPNPDLQNKPHETQDYSANDFERIEDSPVRQMSPATQGLLNTLLSSSDDDDSVKDPNFIVSESSEISDTDSESILLPKNITQEQNMEDVSSNIFYEDLGLEINQRTCEEGSSATNNVSGGEETIKKTQNRRPKRGRKRKFGDYTLAERKGRKYANLPYRGKSKEVSAKTFKNYVCTCKQKCHLKVTEEERLKQFNTFIALGSYEAQLLYICSNVTESFKKRSYISENTSSQVKKPRNFSRTYKISNIPICRDMFLKTFQVTTQKITISLKKQRGGKLRDCRGFSSGGWNKTPQEQIDFVCNILNNLPKYESHYRRSQNGDALYLQPGLTMQKIYDLYVDEFKLIHGTESKNYVSFAIFKKIFLNEFNLKFKSLKKDTCNKCDTFTAKLMVPNELSVENRNRLISEKDNHLKLAESLRAQMNTQIERAKVDETFECLTFDMEKTLPLPRIPTNVVFYKRQLWFYNCGVHESSTNKGYCFFWVEGQAGRGAQEVGSCLKKFISEVMRPNVEYLSLWSDSCGGQNRNIKMVLLLKVILASHPSLKVIDLNFLESGHTFLPNDTDFGKIESHLKHFQRLYTAEDYVNVIKTCTKKTPLVPIKMEKEDFVSTEKLEKNITNRKMFIEKVKVNWLKTKHIQIRKNNIHSVFMRSDDDNEAYQELYIGRKFKGSVLPLSSELLVPLWPNGKPITQAKLNDLKSMFNLIPEDCLSFYKNLQGMEGPDYIEGFAGEQDFDFEDDEEEQ